MKILITLLLVFLLNNGWVFITQSENYEKVQELQAQGHIFTNEDLKVFYGGINDSEKFD